MSAPVRYTSQKQQERISRRQLCERLDQFGWIATPPDEDLGEDFIVHIYLQGRATGVTFHVQEKSVTNLHERRKDDFLVYDFEVKDLKHWESFSLPVVLIVWDIKLREGRWALIGDIISDLEQRRPKWRENKSTVSVRIPWSNTTDDAGLVRLKQSIGLRLYPLVSGDKSLEIQVKLKFPNTDEGKTTYMTFDRAIREGEAVTIQGPTNADVQAINELVAIIEQGKTVVKDQKITLGFKDFDFDLILDLHRQGKPCHLRVSYNESWVELFGSKIPTGRMTRHVTGRVEMSVTELEKAIVKIKPNEDLAINFVNVEIVEIFPDWFIREAQRLSQLLAKKFEVGAVYLFGSLVWSEVHAPETDIDLAISGLPGEHYLEAVSYVERESNFSIDLVELDKVSEHLRQRILTEGKLLYEREPVTAFG